MPLWIIYLSDHYQWCIIKGAVLYHNMPLSVGNSLAWLPLVDGFLRGACLYTEYLYFPS